MAVGALKAKVTVYRCDGDGRRCAGRFWPRGESEGVLFQDVDGPTVNDQVRALQAAAAKGEISFELKVMRAGG